MICNTALDGTHFLCFKIQFISDWYFYLSTKILNWKFDSCLLSAMKKDWKSTFLVILVYKIVFRLGMLKQRIWRQSIHQLVITVVTEPKIHNIKDNIIYFFLFISLPAPYYIFFCLYHYLRLICQCYKFWVMAIILMTDWWTDHLQIRHFSIPNLSTIF